MPVLLDLDLPYVAEARIEVDGRADEPAWSGSLVVRDWVVYYPEPGGAPEVHAEARLLCDAEAFLLHYTIVDPEPHRVRARLGRRDSVWGDDRVGLYLDPAGEAQRGYLFLVNPLGVQHDAIRLAGGYDDNTWDGLWEAEGNRTETGFEVEIRIPWSTIRHPPEVDPVGVSLLRITGRSGERSSWPERDPQVSGILIQENLLGGPGAVEKGANLTLIPSLAFGWGDEGPDTDRWGWQGLAPGATVRYDPLATLALLATVNPDFSQVESDANQIDVNRRYALYYDERRPFFQEGREWFESEYGELVYTRSMNVPAYGIRSTWEQGPWAVAALHVMDRQPLEGVSESGGWTEDELGPEDDRHPALNTVLRGRHALSNDSYVGFLAADKSLVPSGIANRVVGADSRYRLADAWILSGSLLGSATGYADGTTKTAPAGSVNLSWDDEHWVGGLWSWASPADFRAEAGYVTRSDAWDNGLWLAHLSYPSWGVVDRVSFQPLNVWGSVRPSDGEVRDYGYNPALHLRLAGGLWSWLGGGRNFERYRTDEDEEVTFVYDSVSMSFGGVLTHWMNGNAWFEVGEGPYYEDARVGEKLAGGLYFRASPLPWSTLSCSASLEQMQAEGEPLYAGWVGRARLELFASRTTWARFVLDRSSFDDSWGEQVLLAWESRPGQAMYLGGALEQAEGASTWQVFAKVSGVFQP